MQPHLFNDTNPPDVRVAALGDLGGAIGRGAARSPGGAAALTAAITSAVIQAKRSRHGSAKPLVLAAERRLWQDATAA